MESQQTVQAWKCGGRVASAVTVLMSLVVMTAAFSAWFVDPHGDSGGWRGTDLPGDRSDRLFLVGDDLLGVSEGVLTLTLGGAAALLGVSAALSGRRLRKLLLVGAALSLLSAVAAVAVDAVTIKFWGMASDDAWAIPGLKFGGGVGLVAVGGTVGAVYAVQGAMVGTSSARLWRALTVPVPHLLKFLSKKRSKHIGAMAGAVFVVAGVAVPLLAAELLRVDHTRDQVRHWTDQHIGAVRLAAPLMLVGALAFGWWLRAFLKSLSANGATDGPVRGVVMTGAVLAGAIYLFGCLILAGVAWNPEATTWTSTVVLVSAFSPPIAALGVVLMAGGASVIGRRVGVLPVASARLGWGVALVSFIAMVGLAANPAGFNWWASIGFLAIAAWVLGSSWQMWRSSSPSTP